MLSQLYQAEDNSYTLEYPRVWEMEIHEGVPAFFDPFNGKGALQILSIDLEDVLTMPEYTKAFPYLAGKSLEDKMLIFLHMQGSDPAEDSIVKFTKNDTIYIPYEYNIGDTFYMAVMMQKKNRFLLAMYNSSPAPDAEEAKIIGDIIGSIRIPGEGN